ALKRASLDGGNCRWRGHWRRPRRAGWRRKRYNERHSVWWRRGKLALLDVTPEHRIRLARLGVYWFQCRPGHRDWLDALRLRRWRSSWRSDWGWRNGVLARLRRTTGRTGCSNQCQAERAAGHQPLVTIAHRITRRKALAQECGERFLCGTGGKRLTTGVS